MKPIVQTAKDVYHEDIKVGDKIVFSWGGTLRKGIVQQLRSIKSFPPRTELIVRPISGGDEVYPTTATVKNSKSTVKI
jgi:hypothetical protein